MHSNAATAAAAGTAYDVGDNPISLQKRKRDKGDGKVEMPGTSCELHSFSPSSLLLLLFLLFLLPFLFIDWTTDGIVQMSRLLLPNPRGEFPLFFFLLLERKREGKSRDFVSFPFS